jgi:hypothetical protein
MILKYEIKKRKKLQAASLTSRILNDKVKTMNMKSIKDAAIIEQLRMNAYASLRIAKAIEEILKLVKKDMGVKK